MASEQAWLAGLHSAIGPPEMATRTRPEVTQQASSARFAMIPRGSVEPACCFGRWRGRLSPQCNGARGACPLPGISSQSWVATSCDLWRRPRWEVAADYWEEGLVMTTPLNLSSTSVTLGHHTLTDQLSLPRTPNAAVVDLRRVDRGGGEALGCADIPSHGLPAVMDSRCSWLRRFLRHPATAATTEVAVSVGSDALTGRHSRQWLGMSLRCWWASRPTGCGGLGRSKVPNHRPRDARRPRSRT